MKDPIMIQGVNIDINGLGGVPLQHSIPYQGFILWMYPKKFLELAAPDSSNRDISFLTNAIEEGKSLAPPFLNLKWEDGDWDVTMHEGRGRTAAMIKFGVTELIPVHCIGWRWRARDITQEHIDSLKKGMFSETGNYVSSPAVKMILDNKTYDLSSSRMISSAEQGTTGLPFSQ